jgi:diacylglycerol kinase family enzyme
MIDAQPPKLLILINASAGSLERTAEEGLRQTLANAFEQHGRSAQIEFVTSADLHSAVERAVDSARRQNLDGVVIGGGDGSIRTAASVLAGSGVALGVLPLGTLNHFAKDLHIPLAIEEAVAVIARANATAVDLGEVNDQVFINNSSIGLYPHLVLQRERRRKKGLRKWSAMLVAIWRIARRFPLRRLRVRWEEWSEPCRSPCVFVGNNEYHLGAVTFGRRERLDRGELCLYLAKSQSRLSLLWLAIRCLFGLVNEARDLRIVKTSAVEITARNSRLLVALDGEIAVMKPPLRYRTRAGALCVFVPPAIVS